MTATHLEDPTSIQQDVDVLTVSPATTLPPDCPDRDVRARVLIADPDPVMMQALRECVETAGYQVVAATDTAAAQRLMTDDIPIVLVNLEMPKADGFSCLEFYRRNFPDAELIVVTEADDISGALDAIKQGSLAHIVKPFIPEQLVACIDQATKGAKLIHENRGLRRIVEQPRGQSTFTARSVAAIELSKQIDRIAALESPVLLTGERGTGKTTAARMIHDRGPRSDAPFVAINCASLPPRDHRGGAGYCAGYCAGAFPSAVTHRNGRAELAHGGTLFLDEIGDLPLDLEAQLLSLLQTGRIQRIGEDRYRHVDVRVVAATRRDLSKLCGERKFSQELFHRLNVVPISVPSLRDRVEDIPEIVDGIVARLSKRNEGNTSSQPLSITDEAKAILKTYAWPGNLRELETVVERSAAYCRGGLITKEDVAAHQACVGNGTETSVKILAGRTLADIEKQAIIETLEYCKGNKARTARTLGISEKSIYNKMRRHGLSN